MNNKVTMYLCVPCNFRTLWEFSYLHHLRNHEGFSRKSTSLNCSLPLPELNNRNHQLTGEHPSIKVLFICGLCKIASTSKVYYKLHSASCKNNKTNSVGLKNAIAMQSAMFNCKFCTYKGQTECNLYQHHMEHIVKWYQCEECPYKVEKMSELVRHLKTKHPTSGIITWYKCAKCPYETSDTSRIALHIKNRHTDAHLIDWYRCTKCSYITKHRKDLNRHITSKHTSLKDIQWYTCEKCTFQAKHKNNLTRHIKRVHENSVFYKCAQCPFKTTTERYLHNHIKVLHNHSNEVECYQCTECSYVTNVKLYFQRHLRRHASQENIEWVMCDFCPYKSRFRGYLTRHIRLKHPLVNSS